MQPLAMPPLAGDEASWPSPPRRRALLTAAVALLWIGLHVAGVIAAGGRLASDHVLTWAGVPSDLLVERGALVPFLVERGDWQRLVTGAAVVGPGAISLLLALWVFLGASAALERAAGSTRALLVLLGATLAGAVASVLLDPGSTRLQPAGWHLALGAVGARIPLGLAVGGTAGRTLVSGALAFLALSVALVMLSPGGRWIDVGGEVAAFATAAASLACLGPRRLVSPPGTALTLVSLLCLALVLAAAARQTQAALAGGAAGGRALVTQVVRAEAAADRLFHAPNPSRVPPEQRRALGEQLDALEARAADAGDGADALRGYLAALRPIADGNLRDPGAVLARLARAFRAWRPHEERLRQGPDPRPSAPWR